MEDICRSLGISQATFCNWKKKYGEFGASEVRRLRQLKEENLRLKKLVADLTLDKSILQEVIKKDIKPSWRREIAQWIRFTYGKSIESVCLLARLSQTAWYYKPRKDQQEALWMRNRDVANDRPRFGYVRIHALLRREG